MKKKFSKTLTFDSHHPHHHDQSGFVSESSLIESARGRRRISIERNAMSKSRGIADQDDDSGGGIPRCVPTIYEKHTHHQQPLDTRILGDYASKPGLTGTFVPIKNDFTILTSGEELAHGGGTLDSKYRDELHWTRETKEQVKRVRFFICTLALTGLALGVMSRLILNVSIVEMVKSPVIVPVEPGQVPVPVTMLPPPDEPFIDRLAHYTQPPDMPGEGTLDPLIYAATAPDTNDALEVTARPVETNQQPQEVQSPVTLEPVLPTFAPQPASQQQQYQAEGQLHFDWTKQDVNMVLGSFYIGYAPSILFSGGLAQRYGAKWPMFACVFGSALINIFTPLIAQTSLNLLIGSRITLGLIQGSLMPCMYELFNRWLTGTESSIFAPLIKVSMPFGSLIGTMLPGILATLQLDWPNLFYISGALCLAWSLVWLPLATSLPQDNRLVGVNELNRIMRKKTIAPEDDARRRWRQQATLTDKHARANGAPARAKSTPWLLIVTNASVLALTAVKFTYNLGLDFIILLVALYLREVHQAPIETISAIASGGYCMQMFLIAFVGWLAKVVVLRQTFGLSVTKWRKLFQGGSNFLMALTFLMLAYAQPELQLAACLLLLVCFFWMLGAGGESLVPYDLSSEYPASIVGFSHSVSIFSGLTLTAVCDMILGENTEDPTRWSLLFYLLAAALALGGLIFVLLVKAKPFLPGEKVTTRATQQRVSSISQRRTTTTAATTNKLNGLR